MMCLASDLFLPVSLNSQLPAGSSNILARAAADHNRQFCLSERCSNFR
jgi:hypothetical protein